MPAPSLSCQQARSVRSFSGGSWGLRPRQAWLQPFPILSLSTLALTSECTCQPPWALSGTFDLGLTLPLGVGAVGPKRREFIRKEQFNGLFTIPVLNLKWIWKSHSTISSFLPSIRRGRPPLVNPEAGTVGAPKNDHMERTLQREIEESLPAGRPCMLHPWAPPWGLERKRPCHKAGSDECRDSEAGVHGREGPLPASLRAVSAEERCPPKRGEGFRSWGSRGGSCRRQGSWRSRR